MTPHPHAEVLRAIADGVPLSEFEWTFGCGWMEMISLDWFFKPNQYAIRRKTQHIMVNGFKVPKPLDAAKQNLIFAPDTMAGSLYLDWTCDVNIARAIKRGLAHATKEAAIAHAKAMLGIDPEYFK